MRSSANARKRRFPLRVTLGIATTTLCIMMMLGYIAWQHLTPAPRVDLRLPYRKGGDSVIRLPVRRISFGLDWSRKQYQGDYAPENLAVSQFVAAEGGTERLMDIGGLEYSQGFLETFRYAAPGRQPRLHVEYLKRAEAFAGRIIGEGLKPNFAYQIKLRGLYVNDRSSFERIGRLGRWRLPGQTTNHVDAAYDDFPDKSNVESYLLFDFFITDGSGQVNKEFYADSSLHVLWKVTPQHMPTLADSHPLSFARDQTDAHVYAIAPSDDGSCRIFAESEQHFQAPHSRPAIGEAFLPPGSYRAEAVLTEESFHGSGHAGSWATVLRAPVAFEILDRQSPQPVWNTMGQGITLSLDHARVQDILTDHVDPTMLTGKATSSTPSISFSEKLDLARSHRHVLVAEILAASRHEWQILLDAQQEATEPLPLTIASEGDDGWQRFEVEIPHPYTAGSLRIAPARSSVRLGIRNVQIRPVME